MAMMISKFHKIIQSKVVWTVFAILISVAFVTVYTGGKSSQPQSQNGSETVGRLFGKDVSADEFGQAYRSTYLLVSMYAMVDRNFTLDQEQLYHLAWQRLATLKKAKQLGLTVAPEQVVEAIRSFPIFQNPQTGRFDQNIYNTFLARTQIAPQSLESMFMENVLIDKAGALAGQGALVTEDEIKERFHLFTDKLTVEYAAIPRSLAGTPVVTEADAKTYFEANQDEFRFPEKAIVHYVEYTVADYTAQVAGNVTDEMVSQVYEANKQRFVKPETATNAVPEYKALEEVKDELVENLTEALARQAAVNAADALVATLADEATTFEQAAEKAGRTIVANTPAFAATDMVKGVDPAAAFARAAFALEKDASHYYSDPVPGREKVYVISLVKKLPSWAPGFDLVKDDAMESAQIEAAEKAYNEKAAAIRAEIATAVKGGTAFADALSKYGLSATTTEPFDASARLNGVNGYQLQMATIRLEAGTVAELVATTTDSLVAYVAKKEIGDEAATLPGMREELADALRREKAAQLTAAWRESLLEEAGFEDLRVTAADEADSES